MLISYQASQKTKPREESDIPPPKAKLDALNSKLGEREYDSNIFSESPHLTEEISLLIKYRPRDFRYHLFFGSPSVECLEFWFEKTPLELDEYKWATAIALGNNISVLRYFDKKGFFEELYIEDYEGIKFFNTSGLLERAQRFPGEGLELIQQKYEECLERKAGSKLISPLKK